MTQDIIAPKHIKPGTPAPASVPIAKKSKKLTTIILGALLIITLAAAVFFYIKYHNLQSNPTQAAASQNAALVNKVGRLITLPSGETPTVATVSDKSKLKSQPFFKNAADGDKLLIYTNAKEAIIYRPKTNKIINVGPIAITSNTAGTTPQSNK